MSPSETQSRNPADRIKDYAKRTLDLELSRTARAFEPDEAIWDPEIDQMFEMVDQHTRALRRWLARQPKGQSRGYGEEGGESAPLLSIAIFGTYGSGKSSLLKTFARRARRGRRSSGDGERQPKSSLYSLPVIQPNLQADDDHFLYAFLATALEEDLKKNQQEEERLHTGSHNLSPVQQAFEKVSEYLQVLDETRRTREYDPLGVSLERLDRHTSGFRLREALEDLIDSLANGLAGRGTESVLLLPVDDADMSLDRLRQSLDTYRRYLIHPRLVPVFTFTGRVAEELMRVHFIDELPKSKRSDVSDGDEDSRSFSSSSLSTLDVTDHLAVQYLVKLFPIRNRIRLGHTSARIQAASYHVLSEGEAEGPSKTWKVNDLLELSSNLLFGHPEWPITPKIRMVLRPTTLRRQLQVLDAMHEAEVEKLGESGSESKEKPPWVQVFDRAAWLLLNVHRDVLREFGLHMEELYGWGPRGLRREILSTLLRLDRRTRQKLIDRWRYGVEERRGQVLSLLALTVFRPQMLPFEEPSGEDPDAISGLLEKNPWWLPPERDGLSMRHATLWFLHLWLGFYLPQILSLTPRGRRDEEGREAAEGIDLHREGIGWTLRSGALQAMHDFRLMEAPVTAGMVELSTEGVRKLQEICQSDREKRDASLMVHIWCFYSWEEDHWAMVSLWRGLSLLGQIIQDDLKMKPGGRQDTDQGVMIGRIGELIKKHCETAAQGDLLLVEKTLWQGDSHGNTIKALATDLYEWLYDFRKQKMRPLCAPSTNDRETVVDVHHQRWVNCFLRRLHAEYLLGGLWPRLGGVVTASPGDGESPDSDPDEPQKKKSAKQIGVTENFNALEALQQWCWALYAYFRNGEQTVSDRSSQTADFSDWLLYSPLLYPWLPDELAEPEGQSARDALAWRDRPDAGLHGGTHASERAKTRGNLRRALKTLRTETLRSTS